MAAMVTPDQKKLYIEKKYQKRMYSNEELSVEWRKRDRHIVAPFKRNNYIRRLHNQFATAYGLHLNSLMDPRR